MATPNPAQPPKPQQQPQPECPEGCCTGDEILCISIPCPINIVLLGLDLNLELPCVRLSSGSPLTGDQIQQLLQVLGSLLGGLGGALPGAGGAAKA